MKRMVALVLAVVLCIATASAALAQVDATPTDPVHSGAFALGDVNADSALNASDALAVLMYAVEKPARIMAVPYAAVMADVDGDFAITAADALWILKVSVGKADAFPAPQPMPRQDYRQRFEREWLPDLPTYANGVVANNAGRPFPRIRDGAYEPVYAWGFAAAVYILKYTAEHPEATWNASAVLCAANNLHLYLHPHIVAFTDGTPYPDHATESLAAQLQSYASEVPEEVERVCSDSRLTADEKSRALAPYGLLALPFLAQRYEAGETDLAVCFQHQLLGLTTAQRYAVLAETYAGEPVNACILGRPWQDLVYDIKAEAAQNAPLDVYLWIDSHRQELAIVQAFCLNDF